MAGEATVTGSAEALKLLYPTGEVPKSINDKFALFKKTKKKTDFVGDTSIVAIQNAYPQGSSSTIANAQAAAQQGIYKRFQVTRKSHYGVARITGEAAKAAVKTEGALVDLWQNEMDGAVKTELIGLSTYMYGTGDGTLSQILSGSATTTVTLAASANMNYFALGMLVAAVSTTGFSPTVRVGSARVTGIDRKNRTLTFAAALSATVTGVTDTDYLCRFGDNSAAGVNNSVVTGLGQWIVGGSAPGTLFGLNRNQDPVAFAGQTQDYTGWTIEDAVMDATAQAGFIGIGDPNCIVMNTLEFTALKRSLGAKIIYDGGGDTAAAGFKDAYIEGDGGPIRIVKDPFCPRNVAWLLNDETFHLKSLDAAPHLQKWDGVQYLRLPTEDVFEARWAFYGNLIVNNPAPNVRLTGIGL